MAVISPYSSTFSNTYKELNDLVNQGDLQSGKERLEFIKSKGLNPNDFKKALKEYDELKEKEPNRFRPSFEVDRPGVAVTRVAGATLGYDNAKISAYTTNETAGQISVVASTIDVDNFYHNYKGERSGGAYTLLIDGVTSVTEIKALFIARHDAFRPASSPSKQKIISSVYRNNFLI